MFDQSWSRKILKIHKSLQIMEKVKYLQPHFSHSFTDLSAYLGEITASNKVIVSLTPINLKERGKKKKVNKNQTQIIA